MKVYAIKKVDARGQRWYMTDFTWPSLTSWRNYRALSRRFADKRTAFAVKNLMSQSGDLIRWRIVSFNVK